IVFGGANASSDLLNSTRGWDGAAWTTLGAARPPDESGHTLAFDAARGEALLYGQSAAFIQQTWTLASDDWQKLAPTSRPGTGYGHAAAVDPRTLDVLVFGGLHTDAFASWDGATWTTIAADPKPSPRSWAGFAYDAGRSRAVLFGGEDVDGNFLGDT